MRKWIVLVILAVLIGICFSSSQSVQADPRPAFPGPWYLSSNRGLEYIPELSETDPNNLLVNGNMEALPFYWRPPNHFVAGGWSRWWIHNTPMPEYDDVREWRPQRYDGNHAQIYFIWGKLYTAGIFQVVEGVTPCTPYRFSMWGRTHSLAGAEPHARAGLDPAGSEVTPDGAVKNGLPPLMVWSREQTQLSVWEKFSVEAEPLGDRLTALVYGAPRPGSGAQHYYDTFWDAGILAPVSFPDEKLPAPASWTPSGFIRNLEMTWELDELVVTWETPSPASTQVWYEMSTTSTGISPARYSGATLLHTEPVTQHRAVIETPTGGRVIHLAALSRRPGASACVTESSGPLTFPVPDRLPPDDWESSSPIFQNLTIEPVLDNLVVTWETPNLSSTTQVWYNFVYTPTTPPSSTLMLGGAIYLPLVACNSYGYPYKQVSTLDLALTTQHRAVIPHLEDGHVVQLIAASAYMEDEAEGKVIRGIKTSEYEHTMSVPPLTRVYLPAMIKALE